MSPIPAVREYLAQLLLPPELISFDVAQAALGDVARTARPSLGDPSGGCGVGVADFRNGLTSSAYLGVVASVLDLPPRFPR